MVEEPPRCLIGTLYVGENELPQCESALYAQTYKYWKHFRFDNLPELEAHRKLYNGFMECKNDFDLFIKLDPDMVLKTSESLARIVDYFKKRPTLDHACFSVHDYMSSQAMLGLHVFTNRATWKTIENHYYPDQSPEVPGKRQMVWTNPAPVALHSPNPSAYQAFHFGTHRMLKALNPVNSAINSYQWDTIYRIAKHAQYNSDPRLRLALLGSWHVWNGDIGNNAKEALDSAKNDIFILYADLNGPALEEALPKEWLNILATHHRRHRTVDALKSSGRQLKAMTRSHFLRYKKAPKRPY